ncbi:hypothetical protein BAE44_0000048 [Dichanthelium oligosanthes]|uniref:Uncharacterized protein n=1 Tax=Dichanthelium oligosanthes TaxID=888268 RepID=A0A1E5WNL2_9POAL|nr:hypothetical protein BAE44_0000048 [Dichanthelium oligosanthes]
MWQRDHILCCERPHVAVHVRRFSFSANIRCSVRPPLPDRYFGNALVPLFAAGAARDIASEALESTAGRIRGAINRLDDELVRSVVDYHELLDEID